MSAANSRASNALSRMSKSACRARSESIDRLSLGGRPNERFQLSSVRDIDAAGKKIAEILGDRNIFEKADRRIWRDLDHDVDVAVRTLVAARSRPEQRGVRHAARAQGGFVLFQSRQNGLPVHCGAYSTLGGQGAYFRAPRRLRPAAAPTYYCPLRRGSPKARRRRPAPR